MQILTPQALGRLAGAGALGALVGLVGTGVHRAHPPLGLLLALAAVLSAAVLVRAWTGWAGMLALGLGVFTVVAVLANRGPGGDVVIASDAVGLVWYAGALVVALGGLLPGRWFSAAPLGDRAPRRRGRRAA